MSNSWFCLIYLERSVKDDPTHSMEDDPIGNVEGSAGHPIEFIELSSDEASEVSDDLQGVQKAMGIYEAPTVEFINGDEVTKEIKKETIESLDGSPEDVIMATVAIQNSRKRLRNQNERKQAPIENLNDSDVIFVDVPSPKPIVIEDDPNTQELFNSIVCPNSSPPSACLPEIPFGGENSSPMSSQWLSQEDYQRFASQTVLPS